MGTPENRAGAGRFAAILAAGLSIPGRPVRREVFQPGTTIIGEPHGIHDPDLGRRARLRGGKVLATGGPFAETKEQLGGYYLIDVPDLDDAVRWASKCPGAKQGTCEVRPLNKNG